MDRETALKLITDIVERKKAENRQSLNVRTGLNLFPEYPVKHELKPSYTGTQKTFEKAGLKGYLNKLFDNKAYDVMVREGIAPELKDKSYWGRLAAAYSFPLKKVISAGMAAPRAESALYSMTPERKLMGDVTPKVKQGQVDIRSYFPDRDKSPIQTFKEERADLTANYPSSGYLTKETAKAFFNRPTSEYKDYSWAQAFKEKHPESWAAKPFKWAEDTDDWVRGTNWAQRFAYGLAGTPFDIAGLSADIMGDPITYITGGAGAGAKTGVKATKNILSETGETIIRKGSPITLKQGARITLKAGYDDALKEATNSFTLLRNYSKGGLKVTTLQAEKSLFKLGIVAKGAKQVDKWLKILGNVADEAVEGIIRKKVTEGLVENMFKKMSTKSAKELVDYGGLKFLGETIVPGYKFQKLEGFAKALEKTPVAGRLSKIFMTGAGIPGEFLPAKSFVESSMRARGGTGAKLVADIFRGLPRKSINKIDDFLGYSYDLAKVKKELDILKNLPVEKIRKWDKHIGKIAELEERLLRLENKLPTLTPKETLTKNIYKKKFLDDFLKKEELKWGVEYTPVESYFHPRIETTGLESIKSWGKNILGPEKSKFQFGKKLTYSQLKKLESLGELKIKPLQESALQRISESVTAVGRKQMLNEAKGFGSLTKQKGLVQSTLPELKGWYFPEEIIEPMQRVQSAFFGDEAVKTTARVYDKIHTVWKRWALATPGFHMRNFYSDCWSGWMQYGMEFFDPRLWADAAKIKASGKFKVHKLINLGERGTAYSDDLYKAMSKSGEISGGFYAGEALTETTGRKIISKIDPSVWSTKAGSVREDMGRIVAGLIERRHGSNDIMAAFGVKKVFYDYFDLTKTEKNVMKRLAPFYTWVRKNLPRQLELMATRPGKYAAIGKVRKYAENISGRDMEEYDRYRAPWFEELQTFPTKFKTKEGLPLDLWVNLPFGDLEKLSTSAPNEILNMLSPAFKAPLEMLFDRSGFLGTELKLNKTQPAPQWVESTLGKLPNSFLKQIGMEKDEASGRMVISNRALYLLKQFPAFATATRLSPAADLPKTPYDWLSTGAGIKLFPYDEKKSKEIYQQRWISELKDFAEYKEQLTGIPTVGLDDIKTALRYMYGKATEEKYADTLAKSESIKNIGESIGGSRGTLFKSMAKKMLEEYEAELDKMKGADVDEVYALLLELGRKPNIEEIRRAIDDRQKEMSR